MTFVKSKDNYIRNTLKFIESICFKEYAMGKVAKCVDFGVKTFLIIILLHHEKLAKPCIFITHFNPSLNRQDLNFMH